MSTREAIFRELQELRETAVHLRKIADEMEDDASIDIPPDVPLLVKTIREIADSIAPS